MRLFVVAALTAFGLGFDCNVRQLRDPDKCNLNRYISQRDISCHDRSLPSQLSSSLPVELWSGLLRPTLFLPALFTWALLLWDLSLSIICSVLLVVMRDSGQTV